MKRVTCRTGRKTFADQRQPGIRVDRGRLPGFVCPHCRPTSGCRKDRSAFDGDYEFGHAWSAEGCLSEHAVHKHSVARAGDVDFAIQRTADGPFLPQQLGELGRRKNCGTNGFELYVARVPLHGNAPTTMSFHNAIDIECPRIEIYGLELGSGRGEDSPSVADLANIEVSAHNAGMERAYAGGHLEKPIA